MWCRVLEFRRACGSIIRLICLSPTKPLTEMSVRIFGSNKLQFPDIGRTIRMQNTSLGIQLLKGYCWIPVAACQPRLTTGMIIVSHPMALARARILYLCGYTKKYFSLEKFDLFSGLQGKNANAALLGFKLDMIHHPIRQLSPDSNRLAWR